VEKEREGEIDEKRAEADRHTCTIGDYASTHTHMYVHTCTSFNSVEKSR
jgi:hypothetical protein